MGMSGCRVSGSRVGLVLLVVPWTVVEVHVPTFRKGLRLRGMSEQGVFWVRAVMRDPQSWIDPSSVYPIGSELLLVLTRAGGASGYVEAGYNLCHRYEASVLASWRVL